MVGTIGSIGNGAGIHRQGWQVLGMHVLGSLMGGLVVALPLGLASSAFGTLVGSGHLPMLRVITDGLTIAILIILALRDFGLVPVPLPTRHRQVPMAWKYLPGHWSPFVYGFALGTGIMTTIYLASFHALLIILVTYGSFPFAILGFLTFSAIRTIPVVAATTVSRLNPEDLITRLSGRTRSVARLSGLAIVAAALALVGRAV